MTAVPVAEPAGRNERNLCPRSERRAAGRVAGKWEALC